MPVPLRPASKKRQDSRPPCFVREFSMYIFRFRVIQQCNFVGVWQLERGARGAFFLARRTPGAHTHSGIEASYIGKVFPVYSCYRMLAPHNTSLLTAAGVAQDSDMVS